LLEDANVIIQAGGSWGSRNERRHDAFSMSIVDVKIELFNVRVDIKAGLFDVAFMNRESPGQETFCLDFGINIFEFLAKTKECY
jgi:hypothetical protein